ncbi:vacuolar protein sorting-associated protein 16 homolog [Tigriopus californicus]|nr:vacuolar protein sorting-associated protein 16 homolog [Tigriopus californicus]
MTEISAQWIPLGSFTFTRSDIYSSAWCESMVGVEHLVGGAWGGPILTLAEGFVHVFRASGGELAHWKWKNGRVIAMGWSNRQEAVLVTEDGSVFVFSILGELTSAFTMGPEAKDLKITSARVFNTAFGTGIAVLTTAKRFFVVNNIVEPRVRKMVDLDLSTEVQPRAWSVLTDDRQARILVAHGSEVRVISPNEQFVAACTTDAVPKGNVQQIAVSVSGEQFAVSFEDGRLWLGTLETKFCHAQMTKAAMGGMDIVWCADKAVIGFDKNAVMCHLVTIEGQQEDLFLTNYLTAVPELDGIRVMSLSGQEFIHQVPDPLLDTFSIGSVGPGAMLRLATDEFYHRSHKANDYVKLVEAQLEEAVLNCIECATYLFDPLLQKEMLRAAQFGKSFLKGASSTSDKFTHMCVTLRVLNALRNYKVGIPLTIDQYNHLTPEVVIDRLLSQRLYALAFQLCNALKLPQHLGECRVLAHWACYKVSKDGEEDNQVARDISQRLGSQSQISYCDIAAKAAESGKKELAVKLLEHETRISKQVPLLVKLGKESTALMKALNSGNRDLAFTVILHVRRTLDSARFSFLIRKFPLAKVLYVGFCADNDPEALEEWFIQEDDFTSLAQFSFKRAYDSGTMDQRLSHLHNAVENWRKCKMEGYANMAEENQKLLKQQSVLEDKVQQTLVGKTLNQTIFDLLTSNETKLADKLRNDFKMSDKRYMFFRVKALAKTQKWPEIKKLAKQKRQPLSTVSIVRLVREFGGDAQAKEFLNDEFLSPNERFDTYAEFGMFFEAAQAAFVAKSLESLNALETMSMGRDDVIRAISNFKTRLLTK